LPQRVQRLAHDIARVYPGFADGFDVDGNVDALTDHHAAGFQHLVPIAPVAGGLKGALDVTAAGCHYSSIHLST
jgi:hypothetical protein